MSPFGLKFSQMILHTETSKLMYNWSFLFLVLHKPTFLPRQGENVNVPSKHINASVYWCGTMWRPDIIFKAAPVVILRVQLRTPNK